MTKWITAIGAIVILSALAYVGWRSSSSTETNQPTLELAVASVSSFEITTTATGELEARNQVEVRSKLETSAGVIELVPEGSRVKKGDVLIRLDTASIEDQLNDRRIRVNDAQLEVNNAESALVLQQSENLSRVRAGNLKIDLASLALDQWEKGDDKKKELQLQLEVEQAQKDLKRLKDRLDLARELRAQEFLSENEFQLDELAYDKAVARLETAELDKLAYEKYQRERDERTKKSDLEEAEAELERIMEQNEINLSQKQSSLDSRKERLRIEQEKLQELEEQLQAATIIAERDGLVVYATSLQRDMFRGNNEGPLQIGQTVRPNDLLMILPDTSEMVASVRVHESLAGRVRPGLRARVKVDAAGDELFNGTVESIGVLAEGGGWRDPNRREYTVRIALDASNQSERLKPSMRAEAEITLSRVDDALAVPVQAVFNEGPVRYVYVPEGERFAKLPVQLGQISDTNAEIKGGLNAGVRVLLRQPVAGEIVDRPWSAEQLQAVGLSMNEDGQIMRVMPARTGGGGESEGGSAATGGGGEARRGGGGERTRQPAAGGA